MNLTLPNYFRLVKFHRLSPKEQVMHLLFFVTVIAELRDDMVAKVIAERIASKKHYITPDEVQTILENDHYHFALSSEKDLRDRHPDEKAYHLTETAKKELIREANIKFAKVRFWTRPTFLIPILFAMASVVVGIGFFAFHVVTYADVSDLSWITYKKRLAYDDASQEEKAAYLLYFVTHQIKFRPDMTPSVVADRLNDLGDGPVRPELVKMHFEKEKEKFAQSARMGAFIMTEKGKKEIQERLSLLPLKDSGLFHHKWFLEYELVRAYLIIPFWISTLALIWTAGLFFGKLDSWAEKITPE